MLLPVLTGAQTRIFRNTDSLRVKMYITNEPIEGDEALVFFTNARGVDYKTALWYKLTYSNNALDDSMTTVYANYFGNPVFAWKLFDSVKLTSAVLPPGTTDDYIKGNATIAAFNSAAIIGALGYTPANGTVAFNTPSRSLSTNGSNNTFTISATKNARVTYSVNFSIALLVALSNGVVSLDYSTNGGSSWTTVCTASQQYSVAVSLTMNGDQVLSGDIPAGALVRLYRSANTNCTITLRSYQQEVLY